MGTKPAEVLRIAFVGQTEMRGDAFLYELRK